eukprot:CAMPEP_0201596336 /NCGR_PEP_ID=MMETSP0190_2-20130828/193046_1 /ASSEMBLY_ACC=CAM_ASM_000263 /TAXON_ID=37353 /ORGANISM="Rosalina sp." /LENGTH=133 /DNA_ID=CAMNT_0048056637 /DNA_START=2698 /DNA_END=3096 /DNA_ORIENTATION=+
MEEASSPSVLDDEDAHLQAKLARNKKNKKLGALLGSGGMFGSSSNKDSNRSGSSSSRSNRSSSRPPSEETMRADIEAGLPLVGIKKGDEYERKIKDDIEREHWSQESLEWEQKLSPVADAIEKTDITTREKIW